MEKKLNFRKWLTKFVLKTAVLITPGNSGAANLVRKWGYKGELEIIPEVGVDTDLFCPISEKQSNNIFKIGYVGRVVYEKGIDIILRAAKQLLDAGINVEIILCGSGPYTSELKRLANKLGISSSIKWFGELKHAEVPEVISMMDVLILPSRTIPGKWMEQFGHTLIEAMAMKVPVVGSNSGAIPDVIGKDELIFSEGNVDELFKILDKLIQQSGWRQLMAEYGYKRVKALYSDQAVAQRLRDAFLRI